jgi:hypothetical protein
MTREDIKSMALKSEVSMYGIGATYQGLDATEGFVNRLEAFAKLVAKQERERIAKKIEQLPFGDTAASFGVYVREA